MTSPGLYCAGELGGGRDPLLLQITFQALQQLYREGGIGKERSANLNGTGAGHHHFHSILPPGDSPHAYNRNPDAAGNLPNHAYSHRKDRRAGKTANVVSQYWTAAMYVDTHPQKSVDEGDGRLRPRLPQPGQ